MELGQLLYRRLLGNVVGNVEENEFVSKMSHLELVSGRRGQRHEAEAFYFSVFAEGSDVLDEKGKGRERGGKEAVAEGRESEEEYER